MLWPETDFAPRVDTVALADERAGGEMGSSLPAILAASDETVLLAAADWVAVLLGLLRAD